VALQFGHEALAEAHHFGVALALGIEVGTALAAAHGKRGEGILEDLFKGQEFQDAKVDRGVEAEAALIRADSAVHLDAEAAIDLDIAMVIEPRNTEHENAFGLHDALKNFVRNVFGMPLQHEAERVEDFLYGLMEFGLGWILRLDRGHYFLDVVARRLDDGGRHDASTHVNSP
jgi:hypothetical protein